MYIEEVNVHNLGPLKKFTQKFKKFNLIYGLNESGKTYLVEFIINTLFKNKKEWSNLRLNKNEQTKGYVIIKDTYNQLFKLEYPKNTSLDEIIINKYDNPTNPYKTHSILAKLLIVKGSEFKIEDNKQPGLSSIFIKKILSEKSKLELVEKNIQDTIIKKINIENSEITNLDNKGIGKEYKNTIQNLEEINKLLYVLINEYESTGIKNLEKQLSQLINKKEQLLQLKTQTAIKIHQKIIDLDTLNNTIPLDLISKLEEHIHRYLFLLKNYKTQQKEYIKYKKLSSNLQWLQTAKNKLEQIQNNTINKFNLYIYPIIILSILIFVSSLISKHISLIFSLIMIVLSIIILLTKKTIIKSLYNEHETKEICKKFQTLFNKPLNTIDDLNIEYKEQEKFYLLSVNIEKQMKEYNNDILKLQNELNLLITQINYAHKSKKNILYALSLNEQNEFDEKEALDILQKIKDIKIEYQNNLNTKHELELKLKELAVDITQITNTNLNNITESTTFNPKELENIEQKISIIQSQIKQKEIDNLNLKSQICSKINADVTSDWNDVINKLYLNKEQIEQKLYNIKLKIISQFVVYQALQELNQHENMNIQNLLSQPQITNTIFNITNKYTNIKIIDDDIFLENDSEHIPLMKLSTGAAEQIFLGLRIAFAQTIYKTPMFLILDDAFEHVDWTKRPNIIKTLVDFYETGWQIICLTMDDHIKKLIIDECSNKLNEHFKYINL